MSIPFQVAFHELDHSPAIEEFVGAEVIKLKRYKDWITGCRAVIGVDSHSRTRGRLFTVDLFLPLNDGSEVVVNQHSGDRHASEDVQSAIRSAFQTAIRQLKSHAGKKRKHDGGQDVVL